MLFRSQQTDALKIVGYLAGLSPGWTDDAIALYAAEIGELHDVDAALAAAQSVMRSWRETRRPPLALIIDGYRAEKARRDDAGRTQIGRGPVLSLEEGLKVAWVAYALECREQGREPNRQMFSGWAKRVGA